MKNTLITEFKKNAIYRIGENVRMIRIALSKIEEKEIWKRQNQALNPLGNQLLHICGNMTQYVLSGLGRERDNRERDIEFSTEDGYTSDDLLQQLLGTTQRASAVINEASEADLLLVYKVQGFEFSGIGLVLHAVEHFSYHTGQIAIQVKLAIDKPLGFYDGLDLTTLNEE